MIIKLFNTVSILTLVSYNMCNDTVTKSFSKKMPLLDRMIEVEHKESTVKHVEYKYTHSTDSICEEIQIMVLSKDSTLDSIPTQIAFVITLRNPQRNTQFQIKGIAQLTSANESFLDSNKPDAIPYWAADYNKNDTKYTINIMLDVEHYEACALSIKSDNSNQLSSYLKYLPKYPNATVLKLGRCR